MSGSLPRLKLIVVVLGFRFFFKYSQGLHNAAPSLKMHYLIAMSQLLSSVPKQVLLGQISSVFPVVIQVCQL